jgi:hypothetical protein
VKALVTKRAALVAMLVFAFGATQLSCSVNDYCLNCLTGDGGTGNGDADDGGNGNDDAPPDAACVPTGGEICDGEDNDCNGLIDDGVLPEVGELCANQNGVCAGGTKICQGGQIKCDKAASPEICDGLDNNCNGMIDEGDPGGGGKCGTDVGECVAGTLRCQASAGCDPSANCTTNCCVVCDGFIDKRNDPELCNGKDDNCNGSLDEGLGNLGACTWPGATNVGECNVGTLMCQGGGTICMGAVFPKFETCNGLDDDCDTFVDEIFNKQTDPNNCNTCGNVCPTPSMTCINGTNAKATCTSDANCTGGGTCVVNSQRRCAGGTCGFQCNVGFVNLDNQAANGCEYKCSPTGAEECDGIDNDCDGMVDEGLTPPPLCLSGGECGATAPVAQCMGAGGWRCTYPGAVEFPEVSCDGLNNDCDANTDEAPLHLNKGQACNDGRNGICRNEGTLACNAADRTGPLVCNFTPNNINPGDVAETCNARDDDCDGNVDEGVANGTLLGLEWVSIGGGKQMMKYEASRPDAAANDPGVTQTIACSRPGVQPWTNIKYTQALAVCQAMGATLCSEQQWHRACSVVTSNTYPLTVNAAGTLFEAEDYAIISPATGGTPSATRAWVPDYTVGFSSISAMQATPNTPSGSVTQANAATQAPRLAYTLSFGTTGNYTIWVKLFTTANNTTADTVHVGLAASTASTTPTVTISPPAPTACSSNAQCAALPGTTCMDTTSNGIPDTCTGFVWVSAGAFNVNATGNRTLNLYMGDDGARVDQIYVISGAGTPPQTINPKGNTWAYATNPNTYQPDTCNGLDYDTNAALAGNQDDILATGSLASCRSTVGTGVFDMSGNVKEWTFARQPGENPIRGGASNNTDVGISCGLNFTLANDNFFFPNIGFRCCRNAPP